MRLFSKEKTIKRSQIYYNYKEIKWLTRCVRSQLIPLYDIHVLPIHLSRVHKV